MTYFELIKNNELARRIVAVQVITYFGVWFSHIAIFSLMLSLDADPFLISLLAFCMFLPGIIQSPFTGVLADKLPLKKLMSILLLVEISTTFAFVFIDQVHEVLWIFVLIIIRMSAASFYFTCKMSLLPRVLSSEELKVANSLHSIVWSLSYTLGMAIGGIAVNSLGVKSAFLIDGSLFFVAFLIFLSVKFDDNPLSRGEKFGTMLLEGMRYLRANPSIFFLMILHSAVGITSFDAIVALLAEYNYKYVIAVPLAIGFINAIRSVGLVVGGWYFTRIVNRSNISYFFIAQGVGIIIWGSVCESFYVSLIGSFFTGLFTTTLWAYTMTMLQEDCDDKYYGRVIALNDMLFNFVAAMTSLSIGAMASAKMGADFIFYALASIFFAIALFYRQWYRRYH